MVKISGSILAALLCLTGCGKSSSGSNDSAQTSPAPVPPSTPEKPASSGEALTAASNTVAPVAATPAPAIETTNAQVAQFSAAAAAQPDATAASIANDLAAKATSLTESPEASPELKTQIGGAVQSLAAGKDASALTALYEQAKQASLTPQQSQLFKQVSNLASAYVVQRNFSSLSGAQGDVATLVNSLRSGSFAPALPALKSLAQNASLTPQQKQLISTLADQYAPGLKGLTDSLKQGLQGIPGLGR